MDLIGMGEPGPGSVHLVLGMPPFPGGPASNETAFAVDNGYEVARFTQEQIVGTNGQVDRPYWSEFRYRRRYLSSREDGRVAFVTYWQGEKVLAEVPLAELERPDLGLLSAYRSRITEVTCGADSPTNLEFLSALPQILRLRSLSLRLQDITGLRHTTGLRELNLDWPSYRMDVLGKLEHLEDLYLDDWKPGVQSIFCLRRLVYARLHRYGCEDLGPMGQWSQLRSLQLVSGRMRSLEGLPPGARHLDLARQRHLDSLQGLPADSDMREMLLECCPQLHSIQGLERCRHLRFLSLRKLGPVLDLSPLQGMEELERLDLAEKAITEETDLEGIYGHPKLWDLCISRKAKLDVDRLLADSPNCQIRLTSN